jgi:hypothetical protein
MLIAGQRVADQDRVAAVRGESPIGFIADLDPRQRRAGFEIERG